MNFNPMDISVLCNMIEQMSATASDKGDESFGVRLTCDDARMISRGLLLLEKHVNESIAD